MSFKTEYSGLEIAIIGVSCKFPDSENYRVFWDNLCQGKESVKKYTDDEILSSGITEEYLNNDSFIKSGVELEDKNYFDYSFFDYRKEEAALMDPQIRLLHEHSWKAIEDAGYASSIEKNRVGLFLGAAENVEWKMYSYFKGKEGTVDPFFLDMISNSNNISTLISYKLNLTGPSLYVSTSCSSSLMSVNLACKSLLNRECSIAIAGGVKINSFKQKGYLHQEGMIYSKDGHCRAFDEDSSGTIAGEGVGVVVLKRLKDAIKDKDNIYCIIRSCVANNDGNNKVGYTAPSVKGQSDCIKLAHKMAGVDPSSIGYIETHGTGTKLGDPIELRALNLAFNSKSNEKFCAIGSVKTNIGHLDVASGVAGLIKAVLCIKNKQIPPSLNFTKPNPEIDFDAGPFYVNQKLKNWERKENLPLRAGVSSFGIGGTNIHIVLEEAINEKSVSLESQYNLLTLSAKTPNSLKKIKEDMALFLKEKPMVDLNDLSYTLSVGRKDFRYRYSTSFKNREELLGSLENTLPNNYLKKQIRNPSIVFMFSGQGSQYKFMGKELYDSEIFFREQIDNGFNLFREFTGENLKSIIFSESSKEEKVNETRYAQPILFIFEYSLAQLMISWGIKPELLIGHSIGEYVAACLSGVFSFKDALKLVIKRGELMNSLPSGAMISCTISVSEAKKNLTEGISLAAINAENQVVFSGDSSSIDNLCQKFEKLRIPFVRLQTSHAFHSHMLDPILDDFLKELEKVKFSEPVIPFISNVYGKLIDAKEAISPKYWVTHMRETVNFSGGLKNLLQENGEKIFLEIGAGNTLVNLLKQQNFEEKNSGMVHLIRHSKEKENDAKFLLKQIGVLWEYGLNIDWDLIYKNDKRKISLPTYFFEKVSFPTEIDPFENNEFQLNAFNDNKTNVFDECVYFPIWKNSILMTQELKPNNSVFIFFSLGDDFSNALIEAFNDKNIKIIEILPHNAFVKYSSLKYAVNPYDINDLQKIFLDLKNNKIEFDNIIYSWNIEKNQSNIELSENNRGINLLYFSLARIIKTLATQNLLQDKRFCIFTDSLYKINNDDQTNHEQSLTVALSNVLSQEYSVSTLNLDINLTNNLQELIPEVVDEIINKNEDRIVALRNGSRWIQDYQQYKQPIEQKISQLKQEGVYLITGGLGNVGFILSQHILNEYNAKLIIIGRKKLEDGLTDLKSLERLNYLKSISSHVRYVTLDIADKKGLEEIVLEVEQDLGCINGVIHTAGMIDVNKFEYIEDITYENAFSTFSPKLKGIEAIYETFINRNIDFVWITSSLSSVVGGLKFASYSACNLYLDSFITSKVEKSKNWKCVRLGEMSFNNEIAESEGKSNKITLSPKEIVKIFEWSLSLKGRMVLIETILNLHDRIEKAFYNKHENRNNQFEFDTIEKRERPLLSNPYLKPVTDSEKKIVEIIENYFGIAGVGIEDDFFELGGDSLKAMVLLSKIKEIFDVDVSLKEFFDNQSIKSIASKIDEKLWVSEDNNKKFISII